MAGLIYTDNKTTTVKKDFFLKNIINWRSQGCTLICLFQTLNSLMSCHNVKPVCRRGRQESADQNAHNGSWLSPCLLKTRSHANTQPKSWQTPQSRYSWGGSCFQRHQELRWVFRCNLFKRPPACPSACTTQSLQTLQLPTTAALAAPCHSAAPVSASRYSSLLSITGETRISSPKSRIMERDELSIAFTVVITELHGAPWVWRLFF